MKQKILLIDDDELVIKTVYRLLVAHGYQVDKANSALEAVSKVANTDFDLVISDVRMPGENGIVAIEKIKRIYEERKIVCGYIFLSGYAEEDTPAHAIRLGVDKFLYKPFDNDDFLKNIKDELELVHKERELKQPTAQAPQVFIRPEKATGPRRRAVITGIGAVSPNGIGKEAYWKGLKEGKNCVDLISFFDTKDFSSKVAAEIRDFNPEDFIERNEIKRMGRSSHLAIASAKLAVKDADLHMSDELTEKMGVIIGSAVSGLEYVEQDFRTLERSGPKRMRPFLGIAGFAGAISSEISRSFGFHGPSITISTGCTSSTDALGTALQLIRNEGRDILISGGADACVTPGILGAFCQMGAVTTRLDKKASRPFNRDRDGFVISEGGWMFIVEELQHALRRKAKIYGELCGYGASCDAWHMAKPYPSGQYTMRAILESVYSAGLSESDIQLFEAYGNGTPINDSYETQVVKLAFKQHASTIMMPSIKSMLGHPLGASGAQQVAAVLLAFHDGIVHPTINYEVPDPACDLDYVPNVARKAVVNAAVCSSIAFGAKNSAIVVKRYV